jgi:Protein of unknown function (DUF2889)
MPLPDPSTRRVIHTRVVDCCGYRRDDGLWDIEGCLEDIKSYDFDNLLRGVVRAGEPVHLMMMRLTVDDSLTIREVATSSEAFPYGTCPQITPAYDQLVGLAIRPGWRKQIKQRIGGIKGCTHISKLLEDLAVVAFQTIGPLLVREGMVDLALTRPRHLDACHAMAVDGEVVREHYPEWYAGRSDIAEEGADG